MRYAAQTTVSPEKSRAEIETTLARYGATGFAYATMAGRARVEFLAHGRRVRFDVPLPGKDEKRFTRHRKYDWKRNTETQALALHDQEIRRLWRALLLGIKAKLEVVASGLSVFEEEFMAHVVLPDGRTVGEHVVPAIADAYSSGKVRGLLPEFTEGSR